MVLIVNIRCGLWFTGIALVLTVVPIGVRSTVCRFYESAKTSSDGSVVNPTMGLGAEPSTGKVLPDGQTVHCTGESGHSFCFSYWKLGGANNDSIIWIKRGCWDHPDKQNCRSNRCVNDKPYSKEDARFCCCNTTLCNTHVSDVYKPALFSPTHKPKSTATQFLPDHANYREKTIIIALLSVVGVTVVVVLLYLFYRLWLSRRKCDLDPLRRTRSDDDDLDPPSPCYELSRLKLDKLLQSGRFGDIWQGALFDHTVAVKVFTSAQRQYYVNERTVYTLPFMNHESLLKFYGSEERFTPDGESQFVIVLTYLELGSLNSYLKNNTVDWLTCQRMCHSIANGLAHLHTDQLIGDKFKPVIAHRDLNSRNILVKPDLSCVIIDFGFAMCISGSRLSRTGHDDNTEQTSLIDVGTLRYMAPEVLDGAVNLRDCEASLKQIDIYALGLVLWEVCSRCVDLYQGQPVNEYEAPFHSELGTHPTLEEMQLLVSRNKRRPLYPPAWRDSNEAIRLLKETIDDCWDQDGEARLTALCVEERFIEISTLWDVKYRGTTPTSHPYGNSGLPDNSVMFRNLVPTNQTRDLDKNTNIDRPYMDLHQIHHPGSFGAEQSVSESTAETTLSPSEPYPSTDLRSNNTAPVTAATVAVVQSNYKGQNPTLELNTHKRSDEELTVRGNVLLIDGATRVEMLDAERRYDLLDVAMTTTNDNLDSSLVQNDLLNQQTQRPIPFLQNQVSTDPPVVRPKQSNRPGNGYRATKSDVNAARVKLTNHRQQQTTNKLNGFKFSFLNPFAKTFNGLISDKNCKPSPGGATGQSQLAPGGAVGQSQQPPGGSNGHTQQPPGGAIGQSQQPPGGATGRFQAQPGGATDQSRAPPEGATGQSHYHNQLGTDYSKSNLLQHQKQPLIQTQVRLLNGSAVVCPTSSPSPTSSPNDQLQQSCVIRPALLPLSKTHSPAVATSNGRLGIAEVGVAKLQQSNCELTAPLIKHRNPATAAAASPRQQQPEQTSLLLNDELRDKENNNEKQQQQQQQQLSAVKHRVKTPCHLATKTTGRFSLYDDRIMGSNTDPGPGPDQPHFIICKSSISLHHFKPDEIIDIGQLKQREDFQF
ncbi:uncharacterized protein LOC141906846 [Tubulanus polymorphus]|uniref:uncharacterized protein LOC141906846 n=1 Tax=Tubulanus polymorphus TaxID=672921 RepID=UPI003DA2139D